MTEKKTITYTEYLQLDKIIDAQCMRSAQAGKPVHDELFFIIIHQVYELWFKQIIADLSSIINRFQQLKQDVTKDSVVLTRLQRITKIEQLLIEQIDVLETLSPQDFLAFRGLLTSASGFQSYQFRLMEIKLGRRYPEQLERTNFYKHLASEHQQRLQQAYQEPTLFQCVEQWLEVFLPQDNHFWQDYKKNVFAMLHQQQQAIQSDENISLQTKQEQWQQYQTYEANFKILFDSEQYQRVFNHGSCHFNYSSIIAAFYIFSQHDQASVSHAYQLLQAIIDVDEYLTQWRHRHALMVQRMIGAKSGTGGTPGYSYLRTSIEENRAFADLANLSTFLIPQPYSRGNS